MSHIKNSRENSSQEDNNRDDNSRENTVVAIDGGFGEGGGQILRTSVSLAAITGRTVEIVNIRARRSKPGLQAQHLTSVLAAGALCDATLHGATLGSQYLRFEPNALVRADAFAFDVAQARGGASAGATGLVAQTLLVPLTFLPALRAGAGSGSAGNGADSSGNDGGVRVTIEGGTHVPMSPAADYIEQVYLPLLRRAGVAVGMQNLKAGYFPRGGGEIALHLQRGGLHVPLDIADRGRLQRLSCIVTTSQLPEAVARRGADVLQKELKGYGVPVSVQTRDLEGNGAGAAVLIVAECENGRGGWTSLGERGKPMERVASDAVRHFQNWHTSGASVDEHLADQLALPCALMNGESRWTTPLVTEHLRTVLWIAQQFLPIEYAIEENTEQASGGGTVTLRGYAPRQLCDK